MKKTLPKIMTLALALAIAMSSVGVASAQDNEGVDQVQSAVPVLAAEQETAEAVVPVATVVTAAVGATAMVMAAAVTATVMAAVSAGVTATENVTVAAMIPLQALHSVALTQIPVRVPVPALIAAVIVKTSRNPSKPD